ncbi:MAG: M3 family oligoendopeptidase [Crocinitomicaceae bacterium]|nr:M3 family oligoendopeptidase [Crocinitomicaceae bacterium]
MDFKRAQRYFLPNDFVLTSWEDIEPFFTDLINKEINSTSELLHWLKNRSELDAFLEENLAWRYIHMTIDTRNEELSQSYQYFITEIQPKFAPLDDQLNRKLLESAFLSEIEKDEAYFIYIRSVKTATDLFREENIILESEISEKSQLFGSISGAQTIEYYGEQITMQKASSLLREPNEKLRKEIFEKIVERRKKDTDQLDLLFTELIEKRHKVALNAGFENYRDYKFQSLGRFDYNKEDCFKFHESIEKCILPIVRNIQKNKLNVLGKSAFKPWDTSVDPEGKAPLKPFTNGDELLAGTQRIFSKIDPYFRSCLDSLKKMNHLDLESKTGKAPGGYNYPLYESGAPFIFMNAVGTHRDVITMIHEGGHAIHSFISNDLELSSFKNLPSEVAELASMSMELLSMKHWDEFYPNSTDQKRAQKEHLEDILGILPWIAQIDAFQHWVYENPFHSIEDRREAWRKLSIRFGTGLTDWSGFEEVVETTWQRQMHLFEVPFYYIEYGIAQLGALGIWKNSQLNYDKAIVDYKNALQLGYSKSIPKIYETAGIKFDFSLENMSSLADFVSEKLKEIV